MMFARLIAAALAVVAGPALAAPVATIETEIVRGDFHFEHDTVAPGDKTVLALAMKMAPGWHTYWKNAGDSGQPVEIRWEAPEGVEIGEARWPVPHRQPFAPMMNYGYEDTSTLLMPVSVPKSWPAGDPVTLTADVFWLVCKEVCIPEQGVAELTLPTGPATSKAAETQVFADARATFPVPSPYAAAYAVDDTSLTVRVKGDAFSGGEIEDVYFFPAEWGIIDHAGAQALSVDGDGLSLTIPRSPETDEPPSGAVEGVLKIVERAGNGDATIALKLVAQQGDVASALPPALVGSTDRNGGIGFWGALGLAFLGGVILNLMPCVFPVLALKALGFAQMSDSTFRHRAAHGLAYTAGVVALFGALAALFIGLRSAGAAIGWGFQLQNAYVVAGLAYLLFLIGLNLSGVFEVSSRLAGVGSSKAEQGGHRGAFFTGALTAIVATPCTAPFMGTAMGASLTMPPLQAFAVFLALALGLAAPFLLLSISPAAARLMPRPGVWMDRLKQFLAFPMYATAALLVWVLGTLAGPDAMLAAMIGAVFIGLAAWAWGTAQISGERGRRLATGTAAVAAAVAIAMVALINPATESTAKTVTGPGEPFSTARLAELRAEGKPVFINMTADWCITCKVNERVALRNDAFEQALEDGGITYLLGDWTARNSEITSLLEGFGRAGVPLYAVYPREGEPMLLPQILTTDMLVDAFGKV